MQVVAFAALVIAVGVGINQAGRGVDAAGEGARDLAVAGAVTLGAFLAARRAGLI